MATDFFERQAAARRSTKWLIAMFTIAVVTLVAVVFLVASVVVVAAEDRASSLTTIQASDLAVPAGIAGGTLALIGAGSLFKVGSLRLGGGRGVAEGLGGKRLLRDTATDDAERRLLNVVDEMAIASGTPSPPVFLLDDDSINAFAAGYSPSDAVIGVTRGCVEGLTRDELQGVIAHEFSHILNGDMRLSIRMIGILHGILLMGLVGRLLLRVLTHSGHSFRSRGSGKNDSGAGLYLALLLFAVALLILGSLGSLFGGLIKAAVSRQREYLADASAVQFTRNPGGIAGALKRILASSHGATISHPRAPELSHMYFANGVWEGFTSWMATHPPLQERIKAIDPNWDGKLPEGVRSTGTRLPDGGIGFAAQAEVIEVPLQAVRQAVEQIGDPLEAHRRYATELIASIPSVVRAAAGEPSGAQAVVFGLVLDPRPEVCLRQQRVLNELVEKPIVRLTLDRILPSLGGLDDRLRLPLIDLALPSLAAMSRPQYERFCKAFRGLAMADENLSLFEWTLSQVLLRHLRPQFEKVANPRESHTTLYPIAAECGVLLSTLAYACGDDGDAARGYALGREALREAPAALRSREECHLGGLRMALEAIRLATARQRGRVVNAAATVICADRHVAVAEAELLRGVSDLLDCPMPPLLPGQRVA